jgi:hypothetical protein
MTDRAAAGCLIAGATIRFSWEWLMNTFLTAPLRPGFAPEPMRPRRDCADIRQPGCRHKTA